MSMQEQGKNAAGCRTYARSKNKGRQVRFPDQKPEWRRWFVKLMFAVIFISASAWSWLKLTNPETLPIESVRITGIYDKVDHPQLRATILPFLQNNFLLVDTAALQERLQQLPWVYKATVQRVWPNTLVVELTQQQAIARFNDNTLLNVQGELFSAGHDVMPSGLPLFIAPVGQQELILQTYQQMLAALAPLHLEINILALDTRDSWRLQLSNGIILFVGKTEPDKRLQRFVELYPKIVGDRAAMVNYVDLRYAHGVAIRYKGGIT